MLPYDVTISPSDDYRKRINDILRHIGKFLASKSNGIGQATAQDVEKYCEALLKMNVSVNRLKDAKGYTDIELEFEFVRVSAKLPK